VAESLDEPGALGCVAPAVETGDCTEIYNNSSKRD
jgi:hypothetical protein